MVKKIKTSQVLSDSPFCCGNGKRRVFSVCAFKQARNRGRCRCNALTADKRGAHRVFACPLAALSRRAASCSRPPVGATTEKKRGLTSPDDAPLAVEHQPTLRLHGALRRHALISTSGEVRALHPHFSRCWSALYPAVSLHKRLEALHGSWSSGGVCQTAHTENQTFSKM